MDYSKESGMEKGLLVAFLAVIFWSLLLVTSRYMVTTMELNAWNFSFIQLIFGGLAMLLIAGPGESGMNTLKHSYTWWWGALRTMSVVTYTSALIYTTATEASIMEHVDIFIGVLLGWIFLGRKPSKSDIPGHILIFIALAIVVAGHDGGLANPAIWLVGFSGFAIAVTSFLAEIHPESNKAAGVKGRARFTGIVLMVTAFVFFMMTMIIPLLSAKFPQLLENEVYAYLTHTMPTLQDYLDPKLWMAGAVVGALMRGPVMYFSFLAIRLLKTDNYLMFITIMPFVILAMETLTGVTGIMDTSGISVWDIIASVLMVFGAMMIVLTRARTARIRAAHRGRPVE